MVTTTTVTTAAVTHTPLVTPTAMAATFGVALVAPIAKIYNIEYNFTYYIYLYYQLTLPFKFLSKTKTKTC